MAVEIQLPDLGPEIESGDVLEILVSVGDSIEKDQGIVELETDKATLTVPASQAGVVTKINVSEGDTIKIGQTLIEVDAKSAASAATDSTPPEQEPQSAAESKPAAETQTEPADTPDASESTRSAPAEQDAETKTDATPEPSKSAPPTSPPSTPAQPPEPVAAAASPPADKSKSNGTSVDPATIAAGPAMRRFAREVGVDLGRVTGTGDGGRITREDILKVVRTGQSARSGEPSGQHDEFGPIKVEKLSRMRRTIAQQMHLSWSTVPRVTNFDDADVTDLEEFRQESKADYAKQGIKLTSMPFLIKSVALALRNHPVINASIDMENGQAIYKQYVNIGIAVDTDRGLVVPSLKDADKKSIPEIARELGQMAEKVRANQFTLEDLRGSTFTISNLGAIGGTYSTPIVNVPETSIILVGRSRKMPVVIEDQIAIRLMMPMSISYDHRLVDGAAAARFLNEVIGYLKAPSRLLLAP